MNHVFPVLAVRVLLSIVAHAFEQLPQSGRRVRQKAPIEVVSKHRITPEDMAQADSKARQPRQLVSISRDLQHRLSGIRRNHETTSNHRKRPARELEGT